MFCIGSRFLPAHARGAFAALFSGIVLCFVSACDSQTNVRVWSDPTGTFSTEAELVLATPQAVTLKKVNGVTIVVPISRLSAFDRRIVDRRLKRQFAITDNAQRPVVSRSKVRPISQPPSSPGHVLDATSHAQSSLKPSALSQPTLSLNGPRQSPSSPSSGTSRSAASPNGTGNDSLPQSTTQPGHSGDEFFNEHGTQQAIESIQNPFTALNSHPDSPDRARGPASSSTPSTTDSALQDTLRKAMAYLPEKDADAIIESARMATHSEQGSTRKLALEFLSQHDGKRSLDLIFAGLNDRNFDVRWAAFTSLKESRDPRAIGPLSRMLLTSDADQAASILKSFGSQAESSVISLLQDGTPENLVVICSLLSKIGSAQSLPKLHDLANGTSVNKVRLQAQHSIRSIENRIAGENSQNEKIR